MDLMELKAKDAELAITLASKLGISEQPLIVAVTASVAEANLLAKEVKFFASGRIADNSVVLFPDLEILPYDAFMPDAAIVAARMQILYQLLHQPPRIIILSVTTLLRFLPPRSYLKQQGLWLRCGDNVDPLKLERELIELGYHLVNEVMESGEFSHKGSLIDLFPAMDEHPYRIDWFDCEIETIRTFDCTTQLSGSKIDEIKILPVTEFPLTEVAREQFKTAWIQQFGEEFINAPFYQRLIRDQEISKGNAYLPLFFKEPLSTFFEYLPVDSVLVIGAGSCAAAERFEAESKQIYDRESKGLDPLLHPEQLILTMDQLLDKSANFSRLSDADLLTEVKDTPFLSQELSNLPKAHETWLNTEIVTIVWVAPNINFDLQVLSKAPIVMVNSWAEALQNTAPRMLLRGVLERPLNYLKKNGKKIYLIPVNLWLKTVPLVPTKVSKRAMKPQIELPDLATLKIGDPVVHLEHGVGRYGGLKQLTTDGVIEEFVLLNYANDQRLYVPVTSLNLISKYLGGDYIAPLDALGNNRWQRRKNEAKKRVGDAAAELLKLYAIRECGSKEPKIVPQLEYQQFCSEFPFVPTVDQQRAIDDTVRDLTSTSLMDRLICGDVGFGKTEIALRAAFITVFSQYQVAVIVPTTLLAQQHLKTFNERFAAFAITVKMLSRLSDTHDTKNTLKSLAGGKIDIIIGTHKLLQRGIKFHKLGLVIIDEEHRFGVKQKECLKNLVKYVDVLSLTATPIPRTLSMAFADLRQFSIITTPPEGRLMVKTLVQTYRTEIVHEAISREIWRGGQVYYLHNEVTTIDQKGEELRALFPELRIAIAHGQMLKRELARVMQAFYQQKIDLLICTTIIESGLDIPTANTLIVERADRLGLAELHQLRGRIGRSKKQAYAYLLVPDKEGMTLDAQKRINALTSLKELGTGFTLAMNDLEIRGSGELLGERQSGVIEGIGFTLYLELLAETIAEFKEDKEFKKIKINADLETENLLRDSIEIHLPEAAYIPDDYIHDLNQRLTFYKQIAKTVTDDERDALQFQMQDRFGKLPISCCQLFRVAAIRERALKLGIKRLEFAKNYGEIEFLPGKFLELQKIVAACRNYSQDFKFVGQYTLRFKLVATAANEPSLTILKLLNELL